MKKAGWITGITLLSAVCVLLILMIVTVASDNSSGGGDGTLSAEEAMAVTRRSNELFCAAVYYTDLALSTDPETTSFETWQDYMNQADEYWTALEDISGVMQEQITDETFASMYSGQSHGNTALAVDSSEILQVFDSAKAGSRLRTLAEHYGKDIDWARAALQMANGQITADAWNNYAETAETLETAARTAQLTATVVAEVGVTATAAAATGGTSLLAGSYAVVEGASTIIQVLDNGAFILMGGDAYDSSGFVANVNAAGDVLAPVTATAGLLSLDFSNANDAVMSTLQLAEQLNSYFVENKVIGISLNGLRDNGNVTALTKEELAGYIQARRNGEEMPEAIGALLDVLENRLGNQADVVFNDIAGTPADVSPAAPTASPSPPAAPTPEPAVEPTAAVSGDLAQFAGNWTMFYTAVWGEPGDPIPDGYDPSGEYIYMTIHNDGTVDWTIESLVETSYYSTSIDQHEGQWYINNFLFGWDAVTLAGNGYLYEQFADATTDTGNKKGYYVYYRAD